MAVRVVHFLCISWISSDVEEAVIECSGTIELSRMVSYGFFLDASGRLQMDEGEESSKVELKAFPFAAHYTASRTTSPDRSKAWCDGQYGRADDLSHTVAANRANTFCAGETGLEQPRATATGAKDF